MGANGLGGRRVGATPARPAGIGRDALEAAARQAPEVRKHTAGLTIAKVIVVPGKLVNIVAK